MLIAYLLCVHRDYCFHSVLVGCGILSVLLAYFYGNNSVGIDIIDFYQRVRHAKMKIFTTWKSEFISCAMFYVFVGHLTIVSTRFERLALIESRANLRNQSNYC